MLAQGKRASRPNSLILLRSSSGNQLEKHALKASSAPAVVYADRGSLTEVSESPRAPLPKNVPSDALAVLLEAQDSLRASCELRASCDALLDARAGTDSPIDRMFSPDAQPSRKNTPIQHRPSGVSMMFRNASGESMSIGSIELDAAAQKLAGTTARGTPRGKFERRESSLPNPEDVDLMELLRLLWQSRVEGENEKKQLTGYFENVIGVWEKKGEEWEEKESQNRSDLEIAQETIASLQQDNKVLLDAQAKGRKMYDQHVEQEMAHIDAELQSVSNEKVS